MINVWRNAEIIAGHSVILHEDHTALIAENKHEAAVGFLLAADSLSVSDDSQQIL
ncbi:hypothetical protein [Pseudocitrobacter faecalis]|uniref:hypothetical protein n=1 Tax=Pseudocitrobacter faecalis TaxID=1398493 RepID=UPI0039F07F74